MKRNPARRIATETLRTEQRAKMAELVAQQKAARVALREQQRLERAAQMADQLAERAELREANREELAVLRASVLADVEAEDFEVDLEPQAMPVYLTAALYRLHADLAA